MVDFSVFLNTFLIKVFTQRDCKAKKTTLNMKTQRVILQQSLKE